MGISASICRAYFLIFFVPVSRLLKSSLPSALFLSLSHLLYMILFERRILTHFCFLSMTSFTSLLRASLVVAAVVVSMVCSSVVPIQYVNSETIFGSCAKFAMEAGTTITFNEAQTTVNNGNVGVSPGTGITGSPALSPGYTE
jgi:hypothetical protein